MLVPEERVLSPREASCADVDAILPRLRQAGVLTVLSVDPLDHPALEARDVIRPERIAPLAVHVYRLRDALPARERPPRLPTPRRLAAAGALSALGLLVTGLLARGRPGPGQGAGASDARSL